MGNKEKQLLLIMSNKEKQLLLIDLCARLPYGVKTSNGNGILKLSPRTDVIYIVDNGYIPYLRPMSSMTMDEIKYKLSKFFKIINTNIEGIGYIPTLNSGSAIEYINWLNENMFDYRGLIEKGLALEAPEGMYND